jgi:hypothetical protein
VVRLVQLGTGIEAPARALAPRAGEPFDDPLHRPGIGVCGAKVPGLGTGRAVFHQAPRAKNDCRHDYATSSAHALLLL